MAWAAQLAGCSPHEVLDFSASVSPLGPPDAVMAAIAKGLREVVRYPTPGYPRLCQVLAAHHGCEPDYVLPGNGAAELLTWAGRDLAQLQTTYLLTPAFSDYGRSLRAFGADVTPCPIPLAAALLGKVPWHELLGMHRSDDLTACGLLLNTPHNPTGLTIPRKTIVDWLHQFGLVVVDEAFMDFLAPSEQTSVLDWVKQFSNLVVLRSLTKFYSLPGLRLGYAIAQPQRLQRWQQWRDPWSVNSLAEIAAIAALQDLPYQQATWRWLPDCRSALQRHLQAIPGFLPLPGRANYLLVQTPRTGSELQRDLLQRHQILVRDCLSFPELGDRYIRVAVRTQAENQRLTQAIAEVTS